MSNETKPIEHKRVKLEPGDIMPGDIIRDKENREMGLCVATFDEEVVIFRHPCDSRIWTLSQLFLRDDLEYSFNRGASWNPMWKEAR